MIFKPAPNPARWEGVALTGWILITQLLLLRWIGNRETDWLRFLLIALFVVSVPLLLHMAYRTWIAFSLEYWLDRNSLTVRWADVRQTIPLRALQRLLLGDPQTQSAPVLLSREAWLGWPSPFVQTGDAREGDVAMLASAPLAQCMLLETAEQSFALSPQDATTFAETIQERVRMGAIADVPMQYERRFDPARVMNADRTGLMLIGAGLLFGVLVAGVFMARYPGLPDVMTVRFTVEGMPEQVREKESLFLLPALGLMAWVINGVLGLFMAARNQPAAAYLLWGGTLVVQLCALLALLGLIGWF